MKSFDLSKTKVFFTSDPHFFHTNIIKYCNRPFKTVEEMNETLINNWNKKVGLADVVICTGDFAFGKCTPHDVAEVVKSLNGIIYLVEGNHDWGVVRKAQSKYQLFKEVHRELDIRIITNEENPGDYIDIHCAHFPKLVWNRSHYGAWHVFGHCHSTSPIPNQNINQYDVGVDGNNFEPVSVKEVGAIITKRHLERWEI